MASVKLWPLGLLMPRLRSSQRTLEGLEISSLSSGTCMPSRSVMSMFLSMGVIILLFSIAGVWPAVYGASCLAPCVRLWRAYGVFLPYRHAGP